MSEELLEGYQTADVNLAQLHGLLAVVLELLPAQVDLAYLYLDNNVRIIFINLNEGVL